MSIFKKTLPENEVTLKSEIEFIRTDLSYHKVLQKTLLAIAEELNFDLVTQKIVDLIVHDFNYAAGIFFNFDKTRNILYSHTVSNTMLINAVIKNYTKEFQSHGVNVSEPAQHNVLRTFKEKQSYEGSSLAEFISPTLSKPLADITQTTLRIKRIITLPVIVHNDVLGVIMFASRRENFTDIEKEALQTFTQQIALAIRNSTLYKQVHAQVSRYELKNRELSSLYNLVTKISRSLDLDIVSQTAVDSLPQDHGMTGAILSEYSPLDNSITVRAVTQNPISEAARNLLGDFKKYKTFTNNAEYAGTPSVKAIISGEPQFVDDLSTAFSPPIPKEFIEPLLKILNAKSLAVYPIISRGKIVGTISYLIRDRTFAEVDANQKQLFETYTTQIGIALENARLFTEVENVKNNLETAIQELKSARERERDMLDIMGHELRTPMSIVKNALGMMQLHLNKEGQIPVEKQQKYVDTAIESAKREINLIETLLSATKADAKGFQLTLEKVELSDVVNDALEALKSQAQKKGLEIRYIPPAKEVYIYSDRTRIQEIADNFISNAIKYTQEGYIEITLEEKDGFGWMNIKDTGMGIDEEDLKKLGRKFFRAKQHIGDVNDPANIVRPGGTGLGLYVSFSLIKLLEGILDIKSKVGEGSTFSFAMPLYTDQKTVQVERKVVQEEASIESLRKY